MIEVLRIAARRAAREVQEVLASAVLAQVDPGASDVAARFKSAVEVVDEALALRLRRDARGVEILRLAVAAGPHRVHAVRRPLRRRERREARVVPERIERAVLGVVEFKLGERAAVERGARAVLERRPVVDGLDGLRAPAPEVAVAAEVRVGDQHAALVVAELLVDREHERFGLAAVRAVGRGGQLVERVRKAHERLGLLHHDRVAAVLRDGRERVARVDPVLVDQHPARVAVLPVERALHLELRADGAVGQERPVQLFQDGFHELGARPAPRRARRVLLEQLGEVRARAVRLRGLVRPLVHDSVVVFHGLAPARRRHVVERLAGGPLCGRARRGRGRREREREDRLEHHIFCWSIAGVSWRVARAPRSAAANSRTERTSEARAGASQTTRSVCRTAVKRPHRSVSRRRDAPGRPRRPRDPRAWDARVTRPTPDTRRRGRTCAS
mmetsp:Transcript_31946/g.98643  ORF Transcript_31946/g.98643 Transcript_31946/m.98643 type:complete len:444 (-) Transcript_31946:98-1429(-)